MGFRFPETDWLKLVEVQNEWKVTYDDILRYAASGLLKLHAFATPVGGYPDFHTHAGNGRWKYSPWSPASPICLTDEHAAELVHRPYITLQEWKTKNGTPWRCSLGGAGPGVQVSKTDLVIFREEKKLFEDKHKIFELEEKSHEASEQEIGSSERDKLLKQIACLAMLLADVSNRLRKSNKTPNGSQIAEALDALMVEFPDFNIHGVKNSSIRQSIKAGLALLNK